jgi:virginiamycin B lyase
MWFTEYRGNKIGRITVDGTVSEFALPTMNAEPKGIVAGTDGNMWFAERAAGLIGWIGTGKGPTLTASTLGCRPKR